MAVVIGATVAVLEPAVAELKITVAVLELAVPVIIELTVV